MTLVFKLGADLGEYGQERNLTVRLLDADGKELMRFESKAKIPTPDGGQRAEIDGIIKINEVVFPEPGRYQFSLFVDKDVKGTLPIDLVQIPQISVAPKEG